MRRRRPSRATLASWLLCGASVGLAGVLASQTWNESGSVVDAHQRAETAIAEVRSRITDEFVRGDVAHRQAVADAAARAVAQHAVDAIDISASGKLIYRSHPMRAASTSTPLTGSGATFQRAVAGTKPAASAALSSSRPVADPSASPAAVQRYQSVVLVDTASGGRVRISAVYQPTYVGPEAPARRQHTFALLGVGVGALSITQLAVHTASARRARRHRRAQHVRLSRVVNASVAERRRLAVAIHDGAVQDLVGLAFGMSAVAAQAPPSVAPRLHEMASVTRRSVEELRGLLANVYPHEVPADGWASGFSDLVAALEADDVVVEVAIADIPLQPSEQANLLRITRELLRNIRKHAGATHAAIEFEPAPGGWRLTVRDDGNGFVPGDVKQRANGHIGLMTLRDAAAELGARLEIGSVPGAGTTIRLENNLAWR